MKTLTLAIFLTLSSAAFAQGAGLKQGLWEIKPLKQVMDGHDMAAQMAAAQTQMQAAMANLSPEQRKQMQAMMGQHGASATGSKRVCISAAMAARDKPLVDAEGRCEPVKLSHSGSKTSYEFNCTSGGHTMVGKGESTASGDTVVAQTDMTTTDARGRHTMHSETQMTYLGTDCQGVKPVERMVEESRRLAPAK